MAELKLPTTSNIPLKHARVLKGPHQMAYDITNRCNFRCLHCFNRSGENQVVDRELTNDEVLAFVNDVAALKPMNICFCGGEPMLRLDVLCKAASIFFAKDIMVSMVTNGFLITKEKAKRLYDSGVRRIQVSLDGARAETHERLRRQKNAFERATAAITSFREVGFNDVGVAFTPTSFNWHELEDAYRLCWQLGATDLRIQPLMILGTAQQTADEILPNPMQYRHIVRTINKLRAQQGMHIEWGDPVDHLIRFRSICEHCLSYTNVRANGDIEPSPYLPLVVGNVRRHAFSEYWDAGLARVWEIPKIKELAARIRSIDDFGKKEDGVPTVWYEKDIELDLIDDALIQGG
jgi:MoaA/NifB/PqqE/SkfB family radical SAM enzyme